jgi:hypothetical protein
MLPLDPILTKLTPICEGREIRVKIPTTVTKHALWLLGEDERALEKFFKRCPDAQVEVDAFET